MTGSPLSSLTIRTLSSASPVSSKEVSEKKMISEDRVDPQRVSRQAENKDRYNVKGLDRAEIMMSGEMDEPQYVSSGGCLVKLIFQLIMRSFSTVSSKLDF